MIFKISNFLALFKMTKMKIRNSDPTTTIIKWRIGQSQTLEIPELESSAYIRTVVGTFILLYPSIYHWVQAQDRCLYYSHQTRKTELITIRMFNLFVCSLPRITNRFLRIESVDNERTAFHQLINHLFLIDELNGQTLHNITVQIYERWR